VSDAYGIPEAAVRAMAAGTDLLCLGRDLSEDGYLAVRRALSEAVSSGRLPAGRLEEAERNVAQLRAWLATAVPGGTAATGRTAAENAHIGLVAARRAIRASDVPGPLADPLVVELDGAENMAVGAVPWGLGGWVAPGSVHRVPAGRAGGDPARIIAEVQAQAAGRSLIVVVRDAHRHPAARAVISGLVAARADTVVVDMGLPLWRPPGGVHVATYGAARANAQAAAEVLGLAP
jgi:beta-N-acetylhexosaminidase